MMMKHDTNSQNPENNLNTHLTSLSQLEALFLSWNTTDDGDGSNS